MLKGLGGFTILEVMIFLVVSMALLASATIAIGGTNAHTQFNQGAKDLNSKLQTWITDVSAGFPGGTQRNYSCTVSGHPQIESGIGSSSPSCIFLGKAIQVTDGSSFPTPNQNRKLFAYAVFGQRSNLSTGDLVSTYQEATPTAATGTYGSGSVDLTDTYTMTGGIKVLSVNSTSVSGPATSHLVGFFNSFNGGSSTKQNGSQILNAYSFKQDSNDGPANQTGYGSATAGCLQLSSVVCQPPAGATSWPEGLRTWSICLGSDTNKDTALLTVSSNDGIGAQLNLQFVSCS